MNVERSDRLDSFDAAIVGAGFAGLYMLYRLREQGLSVCVFEAGGDVGGTWYWNRYPGARCDIESVDYSYSFSEELQQEWVWSERYPSQPEVLRYLNNVADRFDLRRDIRFNERVTAARFDEASSRWTLETGHGEVTATYFIAATGCLSVGRIPDLPGQDQFRGRTYHTGNWPHEDVDFTGQRVGIIGTGSSGIQTIPMVARQAKELYVFQRTPNFVVPSWNRALDADTTQHIKASYAERRRVSRESQAGVPFEMNAQKALEISPEERRAQYERRWREGGIPMIFAFADTMLDKASNDTAVSFLHEKIREKVHDPAVAEKLLPTDHPVGSKRICVDTEYYETFNRENVTLVDLKETPLESLTADGIETSTGAYALDSIIYATGFDAMTGALLKIDVRGAAGRVLAQEWAHGPKTYLGVAINGFPNMFTITGPGSPSVISNMVTSIEQHVDWISDCIRFLGERGATRIEATPEAQEAWVQHGNDVANSTLFPLANSWYTGANIPGKPRIFMPYVGGVGLFRQTCDAVAAKGYEGFTVATPSYSAPV